MFFLSSHPEPVAGRRVSRLAIAAALALALAAAAVWLAPLPTATARSFSFGTGDVPDLALDRGGTAHLVWAGESGVLYCGIIRGGEACGKPRRPLRAWADERGARTSWWPGVAGWSSASATDRARNRAGPRLLHLRAPLAQ